MATTSENLSLRDGLYLEAGVFAHYDGYHIWLTKGRWPGQPARIALGPQALRTLMAHAEVAWRERLKT